MKKVIVTNNKIVKEKFEGKAEIIYLHDASPYNVYEESRKVAERGGKLLVSPEKTALNSYYKSLVLLVDESETSPYLESVKWLEKCMASLGTDTGRGKEPLFSGMLQNKEINLLKNVIG